MNYEISIAQDAFGKPIGIIAFGITAPGCWITAPASLFPIFAASIGARPDILPAFAA
jgi:hypothetical protein